MKDIDVLNRLNGDTAITDLISDRMWTTWKPENTDYPAITCNFTTDIPINMLDSDADGSELITVNIWTTDKAELNTLIELVKARMNGFAIRQAMSDLTEQELGIYRMAIDYSVWG